jgi:hypothetical protein
MENIAPSQIEHVCVCVCVCVGLNNSTELNWFSYGEYRSLSD